MRVASWAHVPELVGEQAGEREQEAADDRVEATLDDPDADRFPALRDRALVYLLCYSGCRAGEVCAAPHDDGRARGGATSISTGRNSAYSGRHRPTSTRPCWSRPTARLTVPARAGPGR